MWHSNLVLASIMETQLKLEQSEALNHHGPLRIVHN